MFLEVVNEYRPRFVIFDILFPEADVGGDEELAMVAEEKKNLYLASYFTLEESADAAEAMFASRVSQGIRCYCRRASDGSGVGARSL